MDQFDVVDIRNRIGYTFKDGSLLLCAFTHSSFANEHGVTSNERLEFLGDSIVNMVVAEALFLRYPDRDEGFLSKARAQIVSTRSLARTVEQIGISRYLRCGGGNAGASIRNNAAVKADLFESVVGAMMIDAGDIAVCKSFITDKLKDALQYDYTGDNVTDFKSKLIEHFAQKGRSVRFVTVPTPDAPSPDFTSEVVVDDRVLGKGRAASKKKAEQAAAKCAAESLKL